MAALLENYPVVRHIQIDDGKGKALGRSFSVKLWPTFVFLRDGKVVKQLARPTVPAIREGLQAIAAA